VVYAWRLLVVLVSDFVSSPSLCSSNSRSQVPQNKQSRQHLILCLVDIGEWEIVSNQQQLVRLSLLLESQIKRTKETTKERHLPLLSTQPSKALLRMMFQSLIGFPRPLSPLSCHLRVAFGAGCYWGTEKYFLTDFGKKRFPQSQISGKVGFMGPEKAKPNPTYKEVCSGSSGHVEVYDLQFVGGEEIFEQLIRFFFQFHDPTTFNKQGNDEGTQYASVIYCYDVKQMNIASRVKDELQQLLDEKKIDKRVYEGNRVATSIRKATVFYPAHEEHQEYLAKNPNGYCNHRIRLKEWPQTRDEAHEQ
jgi:peptide-methionine (S)-S-oxide reductase